MKKTKKVVSTVSLEIFQICCFLLPCLIFGSNALIYWCAENHYWPMFFSSLGMPDFTYILTGTVLIVQYFTWCWFILKLWRSLFEGAQALPRWFCFLIVIPVAGPLIMMPLMLLGPALRRESPALRRCFLLILLTWIVQAGIFGLAFPVLPWIPYTFRVILLLIACILLLPVGYSEFQLLAGRHVAPWCRRWVKILSVILIVCACYSFSSIIQSDNRTSDLENTIPDIQFGHEYVLLNKQFSPVRQKPKQHLSQLIRLSRRLEDLQEEKALWGARTISIQHQLEDEEENKETSEAMQKEESLENRILVNTETLQQLDKLIQNGPEEEEVKKDIVTSRTEIDFATDMMDIKNLFDIYSNRITSAVGKNDAASAVTLLQLKNKLLTIIAEDGFGLGPLTVYGTTSIASDDIPKVLPLLQSRADDLKTLETILNECSLRIHNSLAFEFARVILRKLQLAQSSISEIALLWDSKVRSWLSFAPDQTAMIAKIYFGPNIQQAHYAASCRKFYQSAPWTKDYYELNFPQKPEIDDAMNQSVRWIQPVILLANDPEPLFRQFAMADSRTRMALMAVRVIQWSAAHGNSLPLSILDFGINTQPILNPINGKPFDYQANEDGSFVLRTDEILMNINKPAASEKAVPVEIAPANTAAAPESESAAAK